jgi:hypothetical protein
LPGDQGSARLHSMQKIPTVFQRNPEDRSGLLNEVNPPAEWVLAGEGVAHRKYDGTCVLLDADGSWWNRREIRKGKTMPSDAIDLGTDPNTGKTMCWVPNTDGGHRKNLLLAIENYEGELLPGTYELCAPNIDTRGGKNPERLTEPAIYRHDTSPVFEVSPEDLTFERLREIIMALHDDEGLEGLVWHHPDGRMAKLKGIDFGCTR